jgi:hypothetical protein
MFESAEGDRQATPMHEIEMHEVSEEFARCWRAAGQHIQKHVQGPMNSWLKASRDVQGRLAFLEVRRAST